MRSQVINFVLYQLGWLACVCGAAQQRPGWGLITALILLCIHLGLSYDRAKQLLLIVIAAVIGCFVEGILFGLGAYQFTSGQIVSWLPPPWIVVMWMQFATLFPFCLRWLQSRYLLSALLGLTGGPLAFLGGEALGAINILPPRGGHLLLLGLLWTLAMPVLLHANVRLFGASSVPCTYRWVSKTSHSKEIT